MDNNYLKNIPANMELARRALKLTQDKMSEQTGIVRSYISDVENGKKTPSFDYLMKIAEIYGISLDFILFNSGNMFRKDNEFLSTINPVWIELLKVMTSAGEDMELKFIEMIKSAFKLTIQVNLEKKD